MTDRLKRNMYGCSPCPECAGEYRATYKTGTAGWAHTVECDDCGLIQGARKTIDGQGWDGVRVLKAGRIM